MQNIQISAPAVQTKAPLRRVENTLMPSYIIPPKLVAKIAPREVVEKKRLCPLAASFAGM